LTRRLTLISAVVYAAAPSLTLAPAAILAAAPGLSVAQPPEAEAARLRTFLDDAYAEGLKLNPQQAAALGDKEGMDKLNDLSDAAACKLR
jgi:hypothetical protein